MNRKLSVAFLLALPYGEAIAKSNGIPLDPESLAGLIAIFVVFGLGTWLNLSFPSLFPGIDALVLMFLVSFGFTALLAMLGWRGLPFWWAMPLIFCGLLFGSALLQYVIKRRR